MKKLITLSILVAMVLTVFAGCEPPRDPNVLYEDVLSEKTKQDISSAFLREYDRIFDWNRIDPCLGTINNCIVFIDRGNSPAMEYWTETIAECVFEWGQSSDLYAYRDGEICYLREAYEKGWLTKEHIRLLHEKHEEILHNWDQIRLEWIHAQMGISNDRFNRDPDVLYTEPLSEYEKQTIHSKILSRYDKTVRWGYVDPYYGTINNCSVVIVHPFGAPKDEAWEQEIAGYTFGWDSPIELYVYYYEPNTPSQTCTLQGAYSKGLLTKEQIGVIHEKHEEYRANFPQMLEQWQKDQEETQGS